jgi:hypothetical protein
MTFSWGLRDELGGNRACDESYMLHFTIIISSKVSGLMDTLLADITFPASDQTRSEAAAETGMAKYFLAS